MVFSTKNRSSYRFPCITLYWYVMNQWPMEPGFIDRIYVATGGTCAPLIADGDSEVTTQQHALLLSRTFRQSTCRQLGGKWSGGHDVSGHCVMLIHACLFLWEELTWFFYSVPAAIQLKPPSHSLVFLYWLYSLCLPFGGGCW